MFLEYKLFVRAILNFLKGSLMLLCWLTLSQDHKLLETEEVEPESMHENINTDNENSIGDKESTPAIDHGEVEGLERTYDNSTEAIEKVWW